MSEKRQTGCRRSDPALEWAKLWQTMAESSNRMVEAWSGSMAPFMLARLSEKPAGFGDRQRIVGGHRANGAGAAACRRLGHRPENGAGLWRLDRNAPEACELQCGRLRAVDRGLEAVSRDDVRGTDGGSNSPPDWREAFAKWSEISNEELIRNQRTDGFLQAQKELLQAGLKLRSRQDDVAEAASAMFGLPTPQGFRRRDATIDRASARGPRARHKVTRRSEHRRRSEGARMSRSENTQKTS